MHSIDVITNKFVLCSILFKKRNSKRNSHFLLSSIRRNIVVEIDDLAISKELISHARVSSL